MNLKKMLIGTALVLSPLLPAKSQTNSQEYPTLHEKKLAKENYWKSKDGFKFKTPKFPLSLLNKLDKEKPSYEYCINDGKEILYIKEKNCLTKITESNHYGNVEKVEIMIPEKFFIFSAEKSSEGRLKYHFQAPIEEDTSGKRALDLFLEKNFWFQIIKDKYFINQRVEKYHSKKKK